MKWRKKWYIVPAVFLPLMILLTGCWDRVEINDRAFVAAVYLDYLDNGKYELSLGFPLAARMGGGSGSMGGGGGGGGGGGTQGMPYTIVTKTGDSIPEAVRKIRSDITREITWGHTRVIVFGRKMAEHGIWPMVEMVGREPTFHTKSYVMVAPREAKEVAYLTPVFERFPSEVLREFAARTLMPDTSVKDVMDTAAFGEIL
ncbi:hypothetical protein LJK88_32195 [Paenibacillus sp. P26]|nr:hypothetical protein LJK88_32195 [Paenibacillus sp. P26]